MKKKWKSNGIKPNGLWDQLRSVGYSPNSFYIGGISKWNYIMKTSSKNALMECYWQNKFQTGVKSNEKNTKNYF